MNILKLCYEFPPIGGGGSQVAAGLSQELVRSKRNLIIVTMAFAGLPQWEAITGIAIHRVPCARKTELHCSAPKAVTYIVSALPEVRRLIHKHRPDLVHAHFIFPDGFITWLLTLVENPERCRVLGEAVRRRIEEYFNWAAVASRYSVLYEQLCHA